jgi:hypothetical protein
VLKSIFIVLLAVFSAASWAEGVSASRSANVSYKVYMDAAARGVDANVPPWSSPADDSRPYESAQLRAATQWENLDVLTARFKEMRDLRFLIVESKPDFLRRISWLFPDDGCFARASLANVQTANAPGGSVTWWYHVAPLVEVDGVKYVLDPAMDPSRPLTLAEWLGLMSPEPGKLDVAVCKGGTYTPYDSCDREIDQKEQTAEREQGWFLDMEWDRLVNMNRDPVQELGDNPPWL